MEAQGRALGEPIHAEPPERKRRASGAPRAQPARRRRPQAQARRVRGRPRA
jgi:hypothetical protein